MWDHVRSLSYVREDMYSFLAFNGQPRSSSTRKQFAPRANKALITRANVRASRSDIIESNILRDKCYGDRSSFIAIFFFFSNSASVSLQRWYISRLTTGNITYRTTIYKKLPFNPPWMGFLCDRILIPFIEIELKKLMNLFVLYIFESTIGTVNLEEMEEKFL